MKRIAILALLAAGIAAAQPTNTPPVRLMFNPSTVIVITGATTNRVAYQTAVTNGLLTLSMPAASLGLTNAPAGCLGVLILRP